MNRSENRYFILAIVIALSFVTSCTAFDFFTYDHSWLNPEISCYAERETTITVRSDEEYIAKMTCGFPSQGEANAFIDTTWFYVFLDGASVGSASEKTVEKIGSGYHTMEKFGLGTLTSGTYILSFETWRLFPMETAPMIVSTGTITIIAE